MSLDVDLNLSFMGYRYAFNPGGMLLVTRSGEDGGEVCGVCVGLERLFVP